MPNPTTTQPAEPGTYQHLLPGAAGPPRCPYSRHLSRITNEYTIQVGYKELSDIADRIVEVWDMLRLDATDEKIGTGFEALLAHVDSLREWTGWGGVPGKYVGNDL